MGETMTDTDLFAHGKKSSQSRSNTLPPSALFTPPSIEIDGRSLPRTRWHGIQTAIDQVGLVLNHLWGLSPFVELADAPVDTPVFGMVFTSTTGWSVSLELTHPLARALVDAVTENAAGLRGSGDISPVEEGVLEYATLNVLESLAEEPPGPPAVTRLLHRDDFSQASATGQDGLALTFRVWLGARLGHAVLRVPETWFVPGDPGIEALGRHEGTEGLPVGLLLPEIVLSEEEFRLLRPGSALLFDASDIEALVHHSHLATHTGWLVSAIQEIRDTATCTEVILGDVSPQPLPPPKNAHSIRPWLGIAELTREGVESLEAGTRIVLSKPTHAPLLLTSGSGDVFAAEWVRTRDGMLAARLTGPRETETTQGIPKEESES